ncbi:MAG: DUF456 domain-containing protein [Geodermatophilaceae bacterium]|nr:DUF456 domain-containing protein [Geodermatophilaceae bacterium]
MAVGLVGVVIPVIPGLLLVAVAGLGWAILAEGAGPWVVFGFMAVVLAVGTVAKYVLPSRTLRQAGAPASTLVLGALGGIVGFFVIPVIGLLVGAVAGIYLGELRRLTSSRAAGRSTLATLRAIGIGLLIELLAGVIAVAIWFVSVLSGVG